MSFITEIADNKQPKKKDRFKGFSKKDAIVPSQVSIGDKISDARLRVKKGKPTLDLLE